MKSLVLATALFLTSLSAMAARQGVRCTEPVNYKEAEEHLNVKVNQPGSFHVGSCLAEEVGKSVVSDRKAGQEPVVDERYVERVARSVISRVQQQEEAAQWKAEVFEKQMREVDFPKFLDEEADLKRENPLEELEDKHLN